MLSNNYITVIKFSIHNFGFGQMQRWKLFSRHFIKLYIYINFHNYIMRYLLVISKSHCCERSESLYARLNLDFLCDKLFLSLIHEINNCTMCNGPMFSKTILQVIAINFSDHKLVFGTIQQIEVVFLHLLFFFVLYFFFLKNLYKIFLCLIFGVNFYFFFFFFRINNTKFGLLVTCDIKKII